MLIRRSERYDAALLPNMIERDMKNRITKLETDMYEIEHEEEIGRIERMARAKREKAKKRRK